MSSAVLRRALRLRLRLSSSAVPTPRRALLHSSPLARRSETRIPVSPSPPFPARFASSRTRPAASKPSADQSLALVLDTEIGCAKDSLATAQEVEVELPDSFPFEIIDNPGDEAVILKREFAGETIQVSVFMDLDRTEDIGEDDEDASEDDDLSTDKVSLLVTIHKGEGPTLEFCGNLLFDEFKIESMSLKKQDHPDEEHAYNGPLFSDLDENLQKVFHKFLEERGIEKSLYDFLQDYMIRKDDKEYLAWLKNMKEFIEK